MTMPDTTCHMSISLDGFVAGPNQSREHPLGKHGEALHRWHIGDERANEADEIAAGGLNRTRGAYITGRNMFGPIRGEWRQPAGQHSDDVAPVTTRGMARSSSCPRPVAGCPSSGSLSKSF